MTNNKLRKNPDTNRQRKIFRFSYHPYSNTVDGQLITYLQQGDEARSSKEMVLQALRMCWLPLAYKTQADAGVDISDQELRRIGLICCHALEQHLAYLRMELGLPHKSSDVLPMPISTMTNPQTLTTMFGLDAGNSNHSNPDDSNNNNNSSSKSKHKIDSDSFIPGEGSFYDETDDMFENI
ncbi:hypothetical protein H6G33_25575 [Calothrix sp. FACHB-1219]|uniref:hypothetical protein n=1 Tax=unclassified Calothrix TaxID=2619626 RepID=UPI0016853A3B|nr:MULTISPECIES: hypothetical protein [unclassified Calothrix]MBD2205649.1 hypothetical protein [Calothrix sp. FACHB-168]MBD2220379.1 hypothetical protein [Calothrix sp. FACHB-1219]